MGVMDSIAAAISPKWAVSRAVHRRQLEILNSGYDRHGASTSKTRTMGWNSRAGSADADATDNLPKLRERSRDLFMGAPLAAGALKRLRTNVVGAGLRLNAQIDSAFLGLTDEESEEWEANAEREWSLWADNYDADASRTLTFGLLQRQNFFGYLLNGDAFAMLPIIPRQDRPYDLRVYSIESDRVCNPPASVSSILDNKLRAGVEVDRYGAPVAYHISSEHPADTTLNTMQADNWSRVEAFGATTGRRNMLHLFEPDRAGQRRGVPLLAIVMEALKQLDRYTGAETDAAVIASLFTAFITSDVTADAMGSMEESIDEDNRVDDDNENTAELGPGMVVTLAPGEKIDTANPGRPNAKFEPFVMALLKQIGSALDIPLELLVLHFESSYSASRAALLEFWKTCKTYRSWLQTSFCQPIYEDWLLEAVLKGRLQARGFLDDPAIRAAWSKAEWHGPSPGQLDPLKEVNAAKTRVDEGFSTRAREAAELTGGDFSAMNRQRGQEEAMRRAAGVIGMSDPPPTIDRDDEEGDA